MIMMIMMIMMKMVMMVMMVMMLMIVMIMIMMIMIILVAMKFNVMRTRRRRINVLSTVNTLFFILKLVLISYSQHNDKYHIGPSKETILEAIRSDRSIVRRLCAIYYSDFICFGYDLPQACRDMHEPRVGTCPLRSL